MMKEPGGLGAGQGESEAPVSDRILVAGIVDAGSCDSFRKFLMRIVPASAYGMRLRYSRAGNPGSLRTGETLSARTRSKMPGAISGKRS
jgi:hypothetical protein